VYAVLAVLVIKQMPLGYLLDGERLQQRAADILQRRVGYHRVDLATMFAGGAWAMLAARPMFSSALVRLGLVGLSGVVVLGLALTGGRMGYATWCVVGLALCVLKWRRYLVLAPAAVLLVLWFAPGITERMLQGFGDEGRQDQHLITSGRNVVWPYVLGKIGEGPMTGFGRQAWARTNLRYQAAITTGEAFGHPHNAYLEFALDNGLIGLCVLLPFYGLVLLNAVRLFRMRGNPAAEAAGGAALAVTLAYVVAAFGAQTFYPTEGAVGMWCLIALATRVARETATVSAVMPAQAPRRAWRQPREVPPGWPARPRSVRGAPHGGLRGAQRVRR
jgi:O-antigen ligase